MRTKRLLLRKRRLSSNKIFSNNGEFKHTNNRIVVTLYTFNRQRYNYISALKKLYFKSMRGLKNKPQNIRKTYINKKRKAIFNRHLLNRINFIYNSGLYNFQNFNKDKYVILKTFALKGQKFNKNQQDLEKECIDLHVALINLEQNLYNNIYTYQRKLIIKYLQKLQFLQYYRQLIYINKSKYNYTYLQYLKQWLYDIFSKNIEFIIINAKRFYLNSDILAESITLKLTKNRKLTIRYLKRLKEKVKYNKTKGFLLKKPENLYLGEFISYYKKGKRFFEKSLIRNLKYKDITGFRLQAKGRLTRRYTASRSITKIKYSGNLINYNSSLNGLSSILLKGNLRSNIQYTKVKSKSRIGSFGIKAWLSAN